MPIKSSIAAFSENGWKTLNVGPGVPANVPYYLAQKINVQGNSYAISGDGNYIAIGTTSGNGNVRIYSNVSNTYTLQATLTRANANTNSTIFGQSLSFNNNGTTLAIGAPDLDGGSPRFPNVAVFTRSANTWSLQQLISPSAQGGNSLFGNSVALSTNGNYLCVAAPSTRAVANSSNRAGKIYMYNLSGNTWTEQANFVGTNQNFYQLGYQYVQIDGNGTVVMATVNTPAPQGNPIFIYTRSGNTWSQFGNIGPTTTGLGEFDISDDANLIVIGQTPNIPTVYSPANSWSNTANIIYSSNITSDRCVLSGDGNTCIITTSSKFLPTIGTGNANGYTFLQTLDSGSGPIYANTNGNIIVTFVTGNTLIYKKT